MKAKIVALAVLLVALAPNAQADAIFSASFKDSSVSVERRVLETYRAALTAKQPNEIQETVQQMQADVAEFAQVGMPTKENLFLLSHGEVAPSGHETAKRVRTGKYLLSIPLKMKDAAGSLESGGILAIYFNVQVGQRTDIIIENFVEIVDRTAVIEVR